MGFLKKIFGKKSADSPKHGASAGSQSSKSPPPAKPFKLPKLKYEDLKRLAKKNCHKCWGEGHKGQRSERKSVEIRNKKGEITGRQLKWVPVEYMPCSCVLKNYWKEEDERRLSKLNSVVRDNMTEKQREDWLRKSYGGRRPQ